MTFCLLVLVPSILAISLLPAHSPTRHRRPRRAVCLDPARSGVPG
ncbi:hypothetical protein ACF09E_12020 [Streptomyces sp. NPDC014891]